MKEHSQPQEQSHNLCTGKLLTKNNEHLTETNEDSATLGSLGWIPKLPGQIITLLLSLLTY